MQRFEAWAHVAALLVFAAALFLLGHAALAGEIAATWDKPETNCDGSPITNLAGFRAYWGPFKSTLADPAAASYRVTGLPPGDWWLAVTAYNTDGIESPVAGPVVKTVAAEEFTVAESTVYYVQQRTDRFILMRVGDVPVGTPCIAEQSVNGYHAVPRDKVEWAGNVQPRVVVAKCQ